MFAKIQLAMSEVKKAEERPPQTPLVLPQSLMFISSFCKTLEKLEKCVY